MGFELLDENQASTLADDDTIGAIAEDAGKLIDDFRTHVRTIRSEAAARRGPKVVRLLRLVDREKTDD